MARGRIYPAEGRKIRHPKTGREVKAGDLVERDSYWNRLERDGDCTITPEDVTPSRRAAKREGGSK